MTTLRAPLPTSSVIRSKAIAVADLIRLRNQTGTILLATPCLWSLVLAADGQPPISLVMIFVAGAFFMRSAGCAINDLVDADIDRQVERTRTRPIPSGRLSGLEALGVFLCLLALAACLLLFLNVSAVALSAGAVALAALYPFAKRWIVIPQAVLGIAFGWGAIMAWVAVRGMIELSAVLIFLATAFWAIGYDTIYAIQDYEDDRRVGVRSSAVLFGRNAWIAVMVAFAAMVACLVGVGVLQEVGVWFAVGLAGAATAMAIQVLQVRQGPTRDEALTMFRFHIWIGLVILLGCFAG